MISLYLSADKFASLVKKKKKKLQKNFNMSIYIHYPTEQEIKVHIVYSEFVDEECNNKCTKNKKATFSIKEGLDLYPFDYVGQFCESITVYIYTSENIDDVMEFDDFNFELYDNNNTNEVRYLNLFVERRNSDELEKIIIKDEIYKNHIRYYGFTWLTWDENVCKRFNIPDVQYDKFRIEFCKEKFELSPYEKMDEDFDENKENEGRNEVDLK